MGQNKKELDSFFNHYSKQGRPTEVGMKLVRGAAAKIFKFAQAHKATSILEVGPGRGAFADLCLGRGIDYLAIEANETMAKALEKKGARVIRTTVPPLPSVDKDFDLAVIINVMEHLNSMRDALDVTSQVFKVLRPGGKFVVCSPDYLNWRRNFFNCDFSHNYVTTRRRLEQLLLNAGFGNIKCRYLSGPLTGLPCGLASALAGIMPFGFLNAVAPNSRLFYKLYKLQLTFLRNVIVIGQKEG